MWVSLPTTLAYFSMRGAVAERRVDFSSLRVPRSFLSLRSLAIRDVGAEEGSDGASGWEAKGAREARSASEASVEWFVSYVG